MKRREVFVIISLFLLSGLIGCIDSRYDLDKLPSQIIVAGDSLTLPIGKSDTATLGKFINDQNVQYIELRNGVYYLCYRDSVDMPVPTKEELKVGDISANTQSNIAMIPGASVNTIYPVPLDATFNFTATNNIPVVTNNVILRVDSVELSNGATDAVLLLTLKLDQITIISGSYDLVFNMNIPAGFVIEPEIGSIQNNKYTITGTVSNNNPVVRKFKLRRFVKTSAPLVFSYNGSVKLKAGSMIKYTSNTPSLSISVNGSNLYVEALKGQIAYRPTPSKVKENIKEVYKFFKDSKDVISFYNPMFVIETKCNFNVPITGNIEVSTKGGTPTTPSNINFEIDPPTTFNTLRYNHFLVSNINIPSTDPTAKWYQMDLRSYLKAKPDSLLANLSYQSKTGSGTIDNPHFIRNNSIGKVNYRFDLPLSFYNDFQLNFSDTIHNVFTDEINKYIFSSGSVSIVGDIVTSIPLNAEITLTIMSKDYAQSSITILNKSYYKATSNYVINRAPLSFVINSDEISTMKYPRHIALSVKMTSNSEIEGKALKASDFFCYEKLRVVKKGGVKVDL